MEINQKIDALKDRRGEVVAWLLYPKSGLQNMKMDGGRLVFMLPKLAEKGIQLLDVTPTSGQYDRSHLNEQVAAHLSIEEEKSFREEDNDLDEQFWKRDA